MNFGEAIQAMKDGKRVCRKGWENDLWITVNYIANYLPRISLGRDNAFDGHKPWYPSQEDMLAEDWEIYALENLHSEKDTYSPFCGKNRD